jgi:TrmH family RNA methyltransferase
VSVYLDHVSIIVIEPKTAGNIGSICRACKNFGVTNIILINPVEFLVEDTFKFGWGAHDLIENIKVCTSFEEAIEPLHIIIGTTNRPRDKQPPLYSPKELTHKIEPISKDHQIGLVFGRENNGLTNQELKQCHYLSTIPLNTQYPAMNLSQSVVVYLYEFFQSKNLSSYKWQLANKKEQNALLDHLLELLRVLPLNYRQGEENFLDLFRRVFGRAEFEKRDIRALIKLFEVCKEGIKH